MCSGFPSPVYMTYSFKLTRQILFSQTLACVRSYLHVCLKYYGGHSPFPESAFVWATLLYQTHDIKKHCMHDGKHVISSEKQSEKKARVNISITLAALCRMSIQ